MCLITSTVQPLPNILYCCVSETAYRYAIYCATPITAVNIYLSHFAVAFLVRFVFLASAALYSSKPPLAQRSNSVGVDTSLSASIR